MYVGLLNKRCWDLQTTYSTVVTKSTHRDELRVLNFVKLYRYRSRTQWECPPTDPSRESTHRPKSGIKHSIQLVLRTCVWWSKLKVIAHVSLLSDKELVGRCWLKLAIEWVDWATVEACWGLWWLYPSYLHWLHFKFRLKLSFIFLTKHLPMFILPSQRSFSY